MLALSETQHIIIMAEHLLFQQQPVCATLLELHKGDMMPSDS